MRAAQRANVLAFGGMEGATEGQLRLWWAEAPFTGGDVRDASRYRWEIEATAGPVDARRRAAEGLVGIESGERSFTASASLFPPGMLPRPHMLFFAGAHDGVRKLYRVGERVQVVQGIVEFDAMEEP